MQVVNITRNQILAIHLDTADTFFSSLIGLLGRSQLDSGEGLWIRPCQSVHTIWMRFPIDVIFLDAEQAVIHMVERMKPFRVSRHVSRAKSALELPAATIEQTGTRLGDQLKFWEK
jgi:uncharacterized membrane protein (UPF0127 family)